MQDDYRMGEEETEAEKDVLDYWRKERKKKKKKIKEERKKKKKKK